MKENDKQKGISKVESATLVHTADNFSFKTQFSFNIMQQKKHNMFVSVKCL